MFATFKFGNILRLESKKRLLLFFLVSRIDNVMED